MKTFDEAKANAVGTVYHDEITEGVRLLVLRGPASLCAYIGVPEDHPLAGFNYDDLPLDCHGGLTFGKLGDGGMRPKGWYWYGWDYGPRKFSHAGKKWGVKEVVQDSQNVIYQFTRLVRLAERIHAKARA